MKIHVVEYNPVDQRLIEAKLDVKDVELVFYPHGARFKLAVSRGDVGDWDVVIFDWQLPDYTGIELALFLRDEHCFAYRILYTSQKRSDLPDSVGVLEAIVPKDNDRWGLVLAVADGARELEKRRKLRDSLADTGRRMREQSEDEN